MGRYRTEVIHTDLTTHSGWNCIQSVTETQGACLFQISGNGTRFTCNPGSGICCLWCVPPGVSSVIIELWGGGGGGGSAVVNNCSTIGGGGGGSAYARKTLPVAAGSCYTICVGAGGQGGGSFTTSMRDQACCCGSKGGTTYITGAGLTNFCAEGGFGGESRPYNTGGVLPNGGWPGNGGDVNVRGGDGGYHFSGNVCGTSSQTLTWGGSSPFGARNIYMTYDNPSQAVDSGGNGRYGGICGFYGLFPGGGGTGGIGSCCTNSTVMPMGGNGAPGLIRIWM
jgi:hypothetical protein